MIAKIPPGFKYGRVRNHGVDTEIAVVPRRRGDR
jgi:hypothetical protein